MKRLISPEPIPAPAPQPAAPTTAEPVDIKALLDVVRRRKLIFIQTLVVVFMVGVVATFVSATVYETHATLLVPTVQSNMSIVDASNPIAAILAFQQPDSVSAQAQVLQSPGFLKQAEALAGVTRRSGVVRPSTKVLVLREGATLTNVIGITVRGGDPVEIQRLATTIVNLHLKNTSEVESESLNKTLANVRATRQDSEKALKKATEDLLQFRRLYRVDQLKAEQEARSKRYVELQSQADEAVGGMTSAQAQIAQLNARLAREPRDLSVPRTVDNPMRPQLEEGLRKLRIERITALQTFQPDSEDVKAIDDQIKGIEQQIVKEPRSLTQPTYAPNPRYDVLMKQQAEMEGSLLKNQQDFASANAALSTLKAQVSKVEPWEVRLNTLTEEREQARARYAMLTERLQDLDLRKSGSVQTVRAIELPELPNVPVEPNRPVLLVLSALFAVVLATGMAFLVEYLDDRVSDPDDVQRAFSLPTLAHVPAVESGDLPVISSLPAHSQVAEAYRSLRSSIGFAGIDAPIRCLQVTSAAKGEGKTTTALNLAIAMANGGKRVILVDADMRRPSVHRLFNIPSTPGLSEILVGMKTLDEAIQDTDVENLQVICAGPVPPNPAELLASNSFDHLLEHLEARADVVIFDTPPCMPITDPTIIASRMDGVLLVINPGKTRKPAIGHVLELLSRARARVVGVVLNRVEATRGGYYYNYYGGYDSGYYTDLANEGNRQRRHGGNGKGSAPKLAAGSNVEVSGRDLSDDELN